MNHFERRLTQSRLQPRLTATRGRLNQLQNWEEMAKAAEYSAPALARLCGVSVRHLQRHFRDCYGLKLQRWLNEVRLCQAYNMLLKADSVKVVAIELGFKQLSHFSREFKRYFGISPSLLQTHQADSEPVLVQERSAPGFSVPVQLPLFGV